MDRTAGIDRTTRAKRLADGTVQGINLILAIGGCIALLARAAPHGDAWRLGALAVYAAGLLAMAGSSALYGWHRDGPRHTLFRRLDKAAIFLMIGGTYTPLVLIGGGATDALPLLAGVWITALAGVLVVLAAPHRIERLSVALYLLLGWAVVAEPGLLARLPAQVTALLVAGGLSYSVGVLFHRSRIAFQEAIWHGFVLLGAACHYAAILLVSFPVAT
jgi:hemolysin III